MAISVLFASGFLHLATNPRYVLDQHSSVSGELSKTSTSPLFVETTHGSEDRQGSIRGNSTTKEQADHHNETLAIDDITDTLSDENPVQSGIEESSNGSVQTAFPPVPDGRVFYRGDPPYGYLPTSYPKQNITLPPVLLDLNK